MEKFQKWRELTSATGKGSEWKSGFRYLKLSWVEAYQILGLYIFISIYPLTRLIYLAVAIDLICISKFCSLNTAWYKVWLTWSSFWSQLLPYFKKVGDAHQHFYELKQCQKINWIQKMDRVNKPRHPASCILLKLVGWLHAIWPLAIVIEPPSEM